MNKDKDSELKDFLAEAGFYLEQGLFCEAKKALKVLESRWLDDPKVVEFKKKFEAGCFPALNVNFAKHLKGGEKQVAEKTTKQEEDAATGEEGAAPGMMDIELGTELGLKMRWVR